MRQLYNLQPVICIEGHYQGSDRKCFGKTVKNVPRERESSSDNALERRNRMEYFEMATRVNCNFDYKSWNFQESELPLMRSRINVLKTKPQFSLSQSLGDALQIKVRSLAPLAYSIDSSATVEVRMCAPGVPPFLIVAGPQGVPCFHRFTSSGFGRFLWHFLAVFGQHMILESIWCLLADISEITILKTLSDKDEYPLKPGEVNGGADFKDIISPNISIAPSKSETQPLIGPSQQMPSYVPQKIQNPEIYAPLINHNPYGMV